LRDKSEVEIEGEATHTLGPRFVFEKLGPPSYTRIRDTDKRKGFIEREGAHTRFHFYDFLFFSSGATANDFPASELRHPCDILGIIRISVDTRILVHSILVDWQHRISKISNHNRVSSKRRLDENRNIPLGTSHAITTPLASNRAPNHDPSATPPSYRPPHR
jgi:hypothetical protein